MTNLPQASDIRPGQILAVEALGASLAVANVDGHYYAFSDICTHRGCSLSDGTLVGSTVVCPCHGGTFEVATGKVVGGPPQTDIKTYAVTVTGDSIEIAEPPAVPVPEPAADNGLPRASEIGPGQVVAVEALGASLAVANVGGQYYAFSNICTHRGCSLSDGALVGATVVCPCHGGTFEVVTGKVVGGPPQTDIKTYAVSVLGDSIRIQAPEAVAAPAAPSAAPAAVAVPAPSAPPASSAPAAVSPAPAPAATAVPADPASAVDVLRAVPLFAGVSEDAMQALAAFAFRRSFVAGDVIVEEGRTGNGLYVVASGRVEVIKGLGTEREQTIANLGAGEPFGEMALLGEWPRTASVRAVEPTECLGMDRWVFLSHLNREPRLAVRMLQTLALRLAESSRRLAE